MRLQGSGVRTTSKTEAAAMTGGRLPSCGLEGRLNAGSPLGPVFNTVLGPCASRRPGDQFVLLIDVTVRFVSLLLVAFSWSRISLSNLCASSCPRSFAHSRSEPYREIS